MVHGQETITITYYRTSIASILTALCKYLIDKVVSSIGTVARILHVYTEIFVCEVPETKVYVYRYRYKWNIWR